MSHATRKLDRRDLLRASGLALGAGALGAWAQQVVRARPRGPGVLVHVELRGGNDGLNTIVPFADPLYRAARPTLGLTRQEVYDLDGGTGLHPELGPLLPLWQRGWMAVVQAVGAPCLDRSHFFNRRVWASADASGNTREGWLGRLLGQEPLRSRGVPVCVHDEPLAELTAAEVVPCVVRDLGDLHLADALLDVVPAASLRELVTPRGLTASPERRAFATALRMSRRAPPARGRAPATVQTLGDRLDTIAGLLEAGHDAPVFATVLDGFDTHGMQAYHHALLLGELAEGVARFFARLERAGLHEDVLLVASSEFGRRVAENGSGGTDHGLAGPVLAFGPRVVGGFHGAPPDLGDLDQGDLRPRIDLRRVLAEAASHLDGDVEAALGGRFEPVGFLA